MNIEEIRNKRVKISPHSITVKDEYDKTRGIVRNTIPYTECRPSQRMDIFKTLKNAGIWGCKEHEIIKNVVIVDGKIYYLHDLRVIEQLEKIIARFELDSIDGFFDHDKEIIAIRKQIAEKASEFLTVIPCYVIK
jgi:hypothetical protein